MSKRLIGIEIGDRTLRIAILNREKGQITVSSLLERSYEDAAELARHLKDQLPGEFSLGDQLVTCLPARSAYVRRMEFPFQDEKKIAAAIPFELSSQLPVSIEDCATATQKAQASGSGASITAAAVPRQTLRTLVDLFEQADVPLHRVDLAPFCYAASLGEQLGDGILVCATDQETTVCLLQNGQLKDYRVLPAATEQSAASHYRSLLREVNVLSHAAGNAGLTVSLAGPAISPKLEETLQMAGYKVEMLSLELDGKLIEAPFLPAAALALRGKSDRPERSFNFRRGVYALKGEWANLKRKLLLLVALFGLTLLVLTGSMTVKYFDKARRAEQLQTEMVKVYRSLFPDAATIVDVPMQLQSAILDLQRKNSLISGSQASALAILKEVSRLPELVKVEVQEFSTTSNELKMAGHTVSFEAVNQIARTLAESALFTEVQVTDAKMSLDGSRVNFRLSLPLAGRGDER